MNSVIITTKEYNKLLASKINKKYNTDNGKFIAAAFGILKKSFGKTKSIAVVNKMRKAWRT